MCAGEILSNFDLKRTFLGGIRPDGQQTDIAHMVYFAHKGLPFAILRDGDSAAEAARKSVPELEKGSVCNELRTNECDASHYHGLWFDSMVCTEEIPDELGGVEGGGAFIESLMLCKPPHGFSTGSHRVASVVWFKGERFAVAFEEGGPKLGLLVELAIKAGEGLFSKAMLVQELLSGFINENVFIEPLTAGAAAMLSSSVFSEGEFIPAAVLALTGNELYAPVHKFDVVEYPFMSGRLLVEGCRPSEGMYRY